MKRNYSIIGGDLRNLELAQMLADDGNIVNIFGLDNLVIKKSPNIIKCKTLEESIIKGDILIGPIPFSRDNKTINAPFSDKPIEIEQLILNMENQLLFAGGIKEEIYELAKDRKIIITDLMKIEELAILNIIATAEGAISEIIRNTEINIQGSNVLILGFGRIGKLLSNKLKTLGCNVTCAARKEADLAWIEAYGYKPINIYQLKDNLSQFDIIINTVPHIVVKEEEFKSIKKECLLLELASNPGGFDMDFIKEYNFKYVSALGLPGKVATKSSAQYIKNIIYKLLKIEIN